MITGINAIGDFRIQRGLGEASRTTLHALRQSGVPVSLVELRYPGFPDSERDPDDLHLDVGSRYPINLICYGLSDFGQISDLALREVTAGKYAIASWLWEFPAIPLNLQGQFNRIDEVWTASRFCQESMAKVTDKPIILIPYPIDI